MRVVRAGRRRFPTGQAAPHDVTEVEFVAAPGSVFVHLKTRDGYGMPSDNVVGEFSTEEAVALCGKLSEATMLAMWAEGVLKADPKREPAPG